MLTIALLGLYFNVTANRTAEFVAASAVQNLRHDLFEKNRITFCQSSR